MTSKAKATQYRQTDAYRQAQKMYRADPEVKAKMAARRLAKRKMKGLA